MPLCLITKSNANVLHGQNDVKIQRNEFRWFKQLKIYIKNNIILILKLKFKLFFNKIIDFKYQHKKNIITIMIK